MLGKINSKLDAWESQVHTYRFKRHHLIPVIFPVIVIFLCLPVLILAISSKTNTFSNVQTLAATNRPPFIMGMSLAQGTSSVDGNEAAMLSALDYYAGPTSGGGVGAYPASFSIWTNIGGSGSVRSAFPNQTLLDGLDQRGVTPVIFMQSVGPGISKADGTASTAAKYSNQSIANGSFDAYFTKWAQDAHTYGKTVILRYDQEMNGTWFPWSPYSATGSNGQSYYDMGNTPANFAASWKHIYSVIHPIAPNVKFFWAPYASSNSTALKKYFPGAAYVDYVGFDAYEKSSNTSVTMVNRYSPTIKAIRKFVPKNADGTSKIPMIVGETGIEDINAARATWLANGYPAIYSGYPDVAGILYFNINMRYLGEPDNWFLAGPPSMLDAYAALASQPNFQGKFPGLPTPTMTPAPTLTSTPTPTGLGTAFNETSGQVSFEAEHYGSNISRNSHTWAAGSDSLASGGTYLTTTDGGKTMTPPDSAETQYSVYFNDPGTYYVWLRAYAPSANSNIASVGLDGSVASGIEMGSTGKWVWSDKNAGGTAIKITVSSAGAHTFSLWEKRDGTRIDKIVLSTSSSAPSGTGPTESAKK